jgi:hypothetical protein
VTASPAADLVHSAGLSSATKTAFDQAPSPLIATSEASVWALSPRDVTSDRAALTELAQRHLLFDPFAGGEPRVSSEPLVLSQKLHENAVQTAESAYRLVSAAAARAFHDEAEGDRYGLADDVRALAVASYEAGERGGLCRVDLLLQPDGTFLACELNSDCPGGQNEAVALPAFAKTRGFSSGVAPTRVVEAMGARIEELARIQGGDTVALMFATAYAEDLQVAALVARELRRRGLQTILTPPTAPKRMGTKLTVRGRPIAVLYRFFPTEGLSRQRNMQDLRAVVGEGGVRSFSSFSELFCQSKLAMAQAHESASTPTHEVERAALLAAVPRTLSIGRELRSELLQDRAGWVLKRDFGRVGDQVFVGALLDGDGWRGVVDEALAMVASVREIWIAQRFVPQATIDTPWGPRFLTLGAYLLDGAFVGYFARVTEVSHVSHDALVVPVFVEAAS